jgi:hypothetical protein
MHKLATMDSQKFGVVLEGIELITLETCYYSIFQNVYLRGDRESETRDQISKALVRVYSKILEYLCVAKRYYEQRTLSRLKYIYESCDPLNIH